MKILLLGSGGRECALAWKISQSQLCDALWIAPGNGGTAQWGTNVNVKPMDREAVAAFVRENGVDMVVAGNEDPLVAGLRGYLTGLFPTLLFVGPDADGARLEGSKDFAKEFMMRHNIPTARYRSFTAETVEEGCAFLASMSAPYVLKADGLAAGKGVIIVEDLKEAQDSLREMLAGMFGKSSATVVVEEFLSGIECSVFTLTDGHGRWLTLPVAKDYKRICDGDRGPNTGGMGAVSPVPFADAEFMQKVQERIVSPTVQGLMAEGIDYRGFIFFGLINVGGDPMVIEYNVRMGDPETEAVMPRIDGALVAAMKADAEGNLEGVMLAEDPRTAVTVMTVSNGYPGSYEKGKAITIGSGAPAGTLFFHAGTQLDADGQLLTSGGRVIAVTTLADSIYQAVTRSYAGTGAIAFEGKSQRFDIGRDLA